MANKNKKFDKTNDKKTERSQNYSKSKKGGSGKTTRGKSEDVGVDVSNNGSLANCGSADNDPKWYMKNAALFGDATRYWISKITGGPIDWGISNLGAGYLSEIDPKLARVPGIMTLDWMPSTGILARTDNYPIDSDFTVAGKNLYNFITHANSRSNVPYEAADIILTVYAADSIYSAIAACIRAYGIARSIVQENRYYGEAVLKSLGFDPTDVITHLPEFREQINYYIALASTIWVPSDIDLIKRHYWMNTNIYSDSEDVTGQLYAYKQCVFYKWTPKTSTQGSELSPVKLQPGTTMTVQQWMTLVRNLIFAILDDDDPQTMMADMLKAYGAENLFALQPITPDYTIMPTHNYEVLLQIHNTDFSWIPFAYLDAIKITQNVSNQCVYQCYDPTGTAMPQIANFTFPGDSLIDFPSGYNVTPEAIMIATRNKAFIDNGHFDSDIQAPWIYCGTELFHAAEVWYYDQSGVLQNTVIAGVFLATNGQLPASDTAIVAQLTRFDFAPFFYVQEWKTDGSAKLWYVFGDNNQGRPLSDSNKRRLHQVAILSELNVPYMK